MVRGFIGSILVGICLSTALNADVDFGSLGMLGISQERSPIPKDLVVGAVGIVGQNRYEAQDDTKLFVPGFVYFGNQLLFMGDRGRYYFYKDDSVAAFGYGRFRLGNLDPSEAMFSGLDERKFELEAGAGINVFTPYALLTFRAASDITGRSNGQEALAWADFPIIKDRLLIMPGCGLVYRSTNLANYYFGGISSAEGTSSPYYESYDTHSTLSPMASLISSYRIDPHWIGMLAMSYERYDTSIKNSPLVQHSGELYAIFGVGYMW